VGLRRINGRDEGAARDVTEVSDRWPVVPEWRCRSPGSDHLCPNGGI